MRDKPLLTLAGSVTDSRAPRTMQFVIERICPQRPSYEAARRRTEGVLPLPVWVYLGCADGEMCTGKAWQITEESWRSTMPALGLDPNSRYRSFMVCEHMGHLIE